MLINALLTAQRRSILNIFFSKWVFFCSLFSVEKCVKLIDFGNCEYATDVEDTYYAG